MWVITNESNINGATAMLYPNVLQKLSDELDSDLVIIPSSIHEIIVMRYSVDSDIFSLRDMIEEVNSTQVAAEEILADTPYLYTRETKMITIA